MNTGADCMNSKKPGHLVSLVMDQNTLSTHHLLSSMGLPFGFPGSLGLAYLNITGVSPRAPEGIQWCKFKSCLGPRERKEKERMMKKGREESGERQRERTQLNLLILCYFQIKWLAQYSFICIISSLHLYCPLTTKLPTRGLLSFSQYGSKHILILFIWEGVVWRGQV